MMQTYFLKKTNFFFIILLISHLPYTLFSQKNVLVKADSLFLQKEYYKSFELYNSVINKGNIENDNIYLKVAYINELFNNIPETIVNLTKYNEKKASLNVYEKINKIAKENNLRGYEESDWSILNLYFLKYFPYIIILFLLLGLVLFSFLVYNYFRKENIKKRYIITLIAYFLILFVILNFSFQFNYVIIKKETAYFRDAPSNAGNIVEKAFGGEKFYYINTNDIWIRVYSNNNFYFIKKDDVWMLN